MLKENRRTKKTTGLVLALILLGCAVVSCGKVTPGTTGTPGKATQTPSSGPTATATPTATPTPTPTPFMVEEAYENAGAADLYRIQLQELSDHWSVLNTLFAGDYALIWLTKDYVSSSDPKVPDKLILFAPANNTDQIRLSVEYKVGNIYLLEDGTVLASEEDKNNIHIYNKLNETGVLDLGRLDAGRTIGCSPDGTIWSLDEENSNLLATGLSGNASREYAFDPTLNVTRFVVADSKKAVFRTETKDETFTQGYLSLDIETGEITYLSNDAEELGGEWDGLNTAYFGSLEQTDADSTWYFHEPGKAFDKGMLFAKNVYREYTSFLQGTKLCSYGNIPVGEDDYDQEFRLYDLEAQTVSKVLKRTDLPDCFYVEPRGVVGNNNVLLFASYEGRANELLIWRTGDNATKIEGFCDLTKDDPEEYLKSQVATLKDKYNIVITPDTDKNNVMLVYDISLDGTTSFGEMLISIDFANSFLIEAQRGNEALTATDGKPISPENMRNNDGASYEFNPHVFSYYYLDVHQQARMESFFNYVDALREGADRFVCANLGAAEWNGSKLSTYFFPVAYHNVAAKYTYDGYADIIYNIPKEEFLEKEKNFEKQIIKILNDVLEDDYSDIEKVLALYEYVTEYGVYDYDLLPHKDEPEYYIIESGYRYLTDRIGICWEIACLYRYLLLQCGVEAEDSMGAPINPDEDLHEWTYVTIKDQGYIVDPTWGLTNRRKPDLSYFMFTDEMRETRDGFDPKSFDIGGYGMYGARDYYTSFRADDDRYSELWGGTYVAFDEENNYIFYRDKYNVLKRFSYED